MNRKQFLRTGCALCLGLAFMPAESLHAAKRKVYKANMINDELIVPLHLFETDTVQRVRHAALEFDVLVVKHEEGFTCLQMMCTHEGVPVSLSGDKLHCSAHGSIFNLKGEVLAEPATKPLHQYTYVLTPESLNIKIN